MFRKCEGIKITATSEIGKEGRICKGGFCRGNGPINPLISRDLLHWFTWSGWLVPQWPSSSYRAIETSSCSVQEARSLGTRMKKDAVQIWGWRPDPGEPVAGMSQCSKAEELGVTGSWRQMLRVDGSGKNLTHMKRVQHSDVNLLLGLSSVALGFLPVLVCFICQLDLTPKAGLLHSVCLPTCQ